jgi:hypothetical protein
MSTNEYKRNYAKQYHRDTRKRVIEILGGKCVGCGFSDVRALQIDHIDGGGNSEYGINGAHGISYYNKIIKSKCDNEIKYQLLCANCNWIKRVENKEVLGRPQK